MRIPLNQLRKLIREELHSSHRQQFLEQRGRRARRERRADEEALEALAAEEGETAATRAAAEQGLAGLEAREAERDVEAVEAGRWPESTRRQWQRGIRAMHTSDDQNYVDAMTTAIQDQPAPTHDDDIRWWNDLIGPLNAPEEEGGLALNLPEAGDEEVSAETQVARVEVPAGGVLIGTDGWTPSGYHYYVMDNVIRFVNPDSSKVVTVSEESNSEAFNHLSERYQEQIDAAVAAHTGAAAAEEVPARTQALVDATESWTAPGQPGWPAMVTKGLMLSGRDLGRQESAWHATLAVGGYSEGVDEDNDPTDNWSQSEWLASEEDTLPSWAEGMFRFFAGGGTDYLSSDGSRDYKFDDVALYHIPKQDEWSWLGNYANETLHDVYDIVSAGTGEEVVATGDGVADGAAQAAAVDLDEQRRQGKLIAERWQRLAGMKVL